VVFHIFEGKVILGLMSEEINSKKELTPKEKDGRVIVVH